MISELLKVGESIDKPLKYARQKVSYVIDLGSEGSFIQMSSLKNDKGFGKEMWIPNVLRSRNVKPNLLVDNYKYISEKDKNRHEAYVEQVRECWESTKELSVFSVLKYLESSNFGIDSIDGIKDDDRIYFEVDGEVPHELNSVKKFWAQKCIQEMSERSDLELMCHGCGKMCHPVDRIDSKVKVGKKLVPFISANQKSFESYGLSNSQNCPMCNYCAETVTRGLNFLLNDRNHHFKVGDRTFIFWLNGGEGSVSLLGPDPDQVNKLFESFRKGIRYNLDMNDEGEFYLGEISLNESRIIWHSFFHSSLRDINQNVKNWFDLQELNDESGVGVKDLVRGLLRNHEIDKLDIWGRLGKYFVDSALRGERLPKIFLDKVLKIIYAEKSLDRIKAVILKMILSQGKEKGFMVNLDDDRNDMPYVCGRIFSVLRETQDAIVKVSGRSKGKCIVDNLKEFSTSPLRLTDLIYRNRTYLKQFSIYNREGQAVNLDKKLTKLMNKVQGPFPERLSKEEQAIFLLGMFHQDYATGVVREEKRK